MNVGEPFEDAFRGCAIIYRLWVATRGRCTSTCCFIEQRWKFKQLNMFNSLIVQKHNQVRTKSKTTHIPKIIFIIDALVFKVLFSLCLIKLVDFSGFIIVRECQNEPNKGRVVFCRSAVAYFMFLGENRESFLPLDTVLIRCPDSVNKQRH